MAAVSVHEAKTNLSRLLRRVVAGEEIVIMRGREPVAKLVPAEVPRARRFGIDRGSFTVPDDFDAPRPGDLFAAFEGR